MGRFRFRRCEAEEIFDAIVEGAAETQVAVLAEEALGSYFRAAACYLFVEARGVKLMYNMSNGLTVGNRSGLIGACAAGDSVIVSAAADGHEGWDAESDGLWAEPTSHVLLFPIMDQSRVMGVVAFRRFASDQVFDRGEEAAAAYFQGKFSRYARLLFRTLLGPDLFMQLLVTERVGAYVQILCSRMMALFGCRAAELWRWAGGEYQQYLPGKAAPKIWEEPGLVGTVLMIPDTVAFQQGVGQEGHSAVVDGDGSFLGVPVLDVRAQDRYAIVLRRKSSPPFFTDYDMELLARISQTVVAGLKAACLFEESEVEREFATTKGKQVDELLDLAEEVVSEMHIRDLVPGISRRGCQLGKADRCRLYLANEAGDKFINEEEGCTPIEVRIGAGFVGHVAATGQVLNIERPEDDPRFDSRMNVYNAGFTRTVLAMPIYAGKGGETKTVAVMELTNRINGPFTKDDERLLYAFSVFCGTAIENARLYRASVELTLQLRAILSVSQSFAQAKGQFQKVLEDIVRNSRRVLTGRKICLFVPIDEEFELVVHDQDIVRGQMGTAGLSVAQRQALAREMASGASLERAATMISTEEMQRVVHVARAKASCLEPDTLRVPVIARDGQCVGVMTLHGRKREAPFKEADQRLLEGFAVFAALALERENTVAEVSPSGSRQRRVRDAIGDDRAVSAMAPPKRLATQLDATVWGGSGVTPVEEWRIAMGICGALGLRSEYGPTNLQLFDLLLLAKDNLMEEGGWAQTLRNLRSLIVIVARAGLERFTLVQRWALFLAVLVHHCLGTMAGAVGILRAGSVCPSLDVLECLGDEEGAGWKLAEDLVTSTWLPAVRSATRGDGRALKCIVLVSVFGDVFRSEEEQSRAEEAAERELGSEPTPWNEFLLGVWQLLAKLFPPLGGLALEFGGRCVSETCRARVQEVVSGLPSGRRGDVALG